MSPKGNELSRREILAAAGAVLLSGLPAGAAPASASKVHFGFTTYVWAKGWDIPTLIANCTRLKAFGVEMRTSIGSAHGVELEIDAARRREVRKRFADSPVRVLGLSTSERFDFPDPAKLNEAIAKAKGYAKLSHDIGGRGIRVFPNDFHKEVPREKTIDQIARALNSVASYAADYGQLVRFENHGSAGRLTTLKQIMDRVDRKNVGIKLNCDPRDAENGTFKQNFDLVKDRLGDTLHMHDLRKKDFPYQLQCDLLTDIGWEGWWLPEVDHKVADTMEALLEQHALWDCLVEVSLRRYPPGKHAGPSGSNDL